MVRYGTIVLCDMLNIPSSVVGANYITLNSDKPYIQFVSFALDTEPRQFENYVINFQSGSANKIDELNNILFRDPTQISRIDELNNVLFRDYMDFSQIYVKGNILYAFVECGIDLCVIKFEIDFGAVKIKKQQEVFLMATSKAKDLWHYRRISEVSDKFIIGLGYNAHNNKLYLDTGYKKLDEIVTYVVDMNNLVIYTKYHNTAYIDPSATVSPYASKYSVLVTNKTGYVEVSLYYTVDLGDINPKPIYSYQLNIKPHISPGYEYTFEIKGNVLIVKNTFVDRFNGNCAIYKDYIDMHYFGQHEIETNK